MTGSPPVDAGGAKESVTCWSPLTDANSVGALGLLGGPAILCNGTVAVTVAEGPEPAKFVGVTRN